MYWTCGQCCVFHNRVLGSNIVIGLYIQGMWSVLFFMWTMWVVCSNIVIGLSILDMWSVLFVSCAGGEIKYSDRTVRIGHVVSVVCSIRGC